MVDKKKTNVKKEEKIVKASNLSVSLKTDKKNGNSSKSIPNLKDIFKDYYQKD